MVRTRFLSDNSLSNVGRGHSFPVLLGVGKCTLRDILSGRSGCRLTHEKKQKDSPIFQREVIELVEEKKARPDGEVKRKKGTLAKRGKTSAEDLGRARSRIILMGATPCLRVPPPHRASLAFWSVCN